MSAHGAFHSQSDTAVFASRNRPSARLRTPQGSMTRSGSGVQVPHGALQNSFDTRGSCFGKVRHFCVLGRSGSQRDLFRFQSGRAASTAAADEAGLRRSAGISRYPHRVRSRWDNSIRWLLVPAPRARSAERGAWHWWFGATI